MSPTDLKELHLADLHARAAEAGIEGFRKLGRDQLVERLEGGADRPRRRRGRRGGRGRGGQGRERLQSNEGDSGGEEESATTEEVTGVLEVTRQRHGFLRIEGSSDDVYVSASQIRRCELSDGDEVTGPARAPRRGERHPALVRVGLVNGSEPVDGPPDKPSGRGRKARFDSLTPTAPSRRLELPSDADLLVRAADLLCPLAFGQRVLVQAAPRSGRTALLRGLAKSFASIEEIKLTVLLIDERPEEVTAWTEALPDVELALAPADLSPAEQVKVATKAIDRARDAAADGADAVLICDSLTRLAVAADGVDEVKRLFGSGRALAEDDGGSLTVIATTLGEGDDEGGAERAVQTTETALIALDQTLASQGVEPAFKFSQLRAIGEDALLSEPEAEGLRALRTKLAELVPPEAAALVREELSDGKPNAEILRGLA